MFEQKGLFQADVSIHHALCATALQNYHTSAKRLQSGGPCDPFGGPEVDDSALQAQLSYSELPSNEWGFGRMPERIAAAQETSSEGSEANAEGPVVRLPHLQVCKYKLLTACQCNTVVLFCTFCKDMEKLDKWDMKSDQHVPLHFVVSVMCAVRTSTC